MVHDLTLHNPLFEKLLLCYRNEAFNRLRLASLQKLGGIIQWESITNSCQDLLPCPEVVTVVISFHESKYTLLVAEVSCLGHRSWQSSKE